MYIQFIKNVIEFEKKYSYNVTTNIIPIQSTTHNAAHMFMNYKWGIDLLYLDASHTSIDVYIEMTQYFPLVTCNGVMYGDDYGIESVKVAVDAWIVKNNVSMQVYQGIGNRCWVIKKHCENVEIII